MRWANHSMEDSTMFRQSLLRTALSALAVLGIVPVASAAEALTLEETVCGSAKPNFDQSSELLR